MQRDEGDRWSDHTIGLGAGLRERWYLEPRSL